MSGTETIKMLNVYEQMRAPTMFFAGMFQSPQQNFHTSEEVEFDIVRSDEDIAIVITDLSTGYRMNSTDLSTNKKFKPPILNEAVPLNSFDLLNRMPGQNPFQDVNYRANVTARMLQGMVKVEGKIRRTMELQASQVLQTGTITLTDSNGVALYTLDFLPKAAHFPTAGTSWASATADQKADDIQSLAQAIRSNGLANPDQLVMGVDVFENLMRDTDFREVRFNTRRADLGTVAPLDRNGEGGEYRGTVEIGNYRYDMWTYAGEYKDPQTSAKTSFMEKGKMIVRASSGRLDATFGAIPNIGRMLGVNGPQLLPELPGRLSSRAGGMDLFTNVWLSDDGQQLFGGVGTRPLMIPTAIDTFGCLDTGL